MKQVLITVIILINAAAVRADQAGSAETKPYLGFAVPFPEAGSETIYPVKDGRRIPAREVSLTLTIGASGKVKEITDYPDTISQLTPIIKKLKKLKFEISEGNSIGDRIVIPAKLSLFRPAVTEVMAELKLPINSEFKSDTVLLGEFYRANGISPPAVTDLPPIFYKVFPESEIPNVLTISAWVMLDAAGELDQVSFPIAGQDDMTHPVFMGLRNASFKAATFNSEPFATGFWVTFRIFDNIKYPFSPTMETDSANAPKWTERFFMTPYYNCADMSLPPLPRRHTGGTIRSAKYGRSGIGLARTRVVIDTIGRVSKMSVISSDPYMFEAVRDAVKLATWYPAVSADRQKVEFSGDILLEFDASSFIRYSPSWLKDR